MNYLKFMSHILVGILFFGIMGIPWYIGGQEKFPNKPITLIVSWAPGGGMDLNARAIQPHVEKNLGQPVIILNKPGGGATIGFTEGARALPDGYTITHLSASIITTHYTVSPDIHYRNYDPVILVGFTPRTVTVRAEAPWKSLKEFLDYAKANPGKIRMVNSGHGGSGHIHAIGFEMTTGAKFTHVPFKGYAPALMALVGGHAEATVSGLADEFNLVKSGKLKVLAIAAPERMSDLPDVPTFKELGMDPGGFLGSLYGFVVPKRTPKDRIKILHDAFRKGMESPEYIEYTKSQGVMNYYLGPEEFLEFLEKEDKEWSRLIEAAGITKLK